MNCMCKVIYKKRMSTLKWNKGKSFDWLIQSTKNCSYTGKNDDNNYFSSIIYLNRPRKIQQHVFVSSIYNYIYVYIAYMVIGWL